RGKGEEMDGRLQQGARWQVDEGPVLDERRVERGQRVSTEVGMAGQLAGDQIPIPRQPRPQAADERPAGAPGGRRQLRPVMAVDEHHLDGAIGGWAPVAASQPTCYVR